ncbi:hypothetical protein PTSG_09542 [Salpingoeca rosetta]|uniref:Uncharacterized protein n=1 Tax=Salpingoeca rosetta (strain ATCC 50818 / BSB-021) TaxID=946362 RepID=F2ULA8_SALR5|nr:uncharacterized protein PTSG_09542 [Salpingoeca rosetta]EGD77907.1 hypothetical protein PTSG_09542 [Salpingoeca rosetta]|eukprot:XP_004989971.1 hypothetical protein PTSG_09542 [Salpingoeca rosetta]
MGTAFVFTRNASASSFVNITNTGTDCTERFATTTPAPTTTYVDPPVVDTYCDACHLVDSEEPVPNLDVSLQPNAGDTSTFDEQSGVWSISSSVSMVTIQPVSQDFVVVRYRLTFPEGCCTATRASIELRAQANNQGPFVLLHSATDIAIAPNTTFELPACSSPLQAFTSYVLHVRPEEPGTLAVSDIGLIRQKCAISDGASFHGVVPHHLTANGDVTIYSNNITQFHDTLSAQGILTTPTVTLLSATSGSFTIRVEGYMGDDAISLFLNSSQSLAPPISLLHAINTGTASATLSGREPGTLGPLGYGVVYGNIPHAGDSMAYSLIFTKSSPPFGQPPTKYEAKIQSQSGSNLDFQLPANIPPGAYDVTVSTIIGEPTTALDLFTVIQGPHITFIEPPQARPGDLITITGKRLAEVSPSVFYGPSHIFPLFANATYILARLPSDPSSTLERLRVATIIGQVISDPYPLLVVTQITPSAPVPGQQAHIYISNLASQPEFVVSQVFVGNVPASIVGIESGAVVINMPPVHLNSTDVRVVLYDDRELSALLGVGVLFHTIAPNVGVPDMTITIRGSFYAPNITAASLAGIPVDALTPITSSSIVVVPAGYGRTPPPLRTVSVTLNQEVLELPQFSFTYATPVITAISAPVTWTGHILSLYGMDLIAPSEPSSIHYTILLDGVQLVTLALSSTEIVVQVPSGVMPYPEPKQLDLFWNMAHAAEFSEGPEVLQAPKVTGITPSTALPSQVVVLLAEDIPLGYGFQGAVYIAGTQAVVLDITTTNITAIVPPTARSTDNADGSGAVDLEVYVDNSPVQVQGSAALSLYAPVQITEVTPITVSEGVRVTLTGQSFVAGGVDATSVTVDGVDAVVESVTETAIVLRMPALASRVGTRADVVFSVRATALYGSPRVQVTRSVRVISSGGITEVVPAKWKAGDVVRISAQRGTALSTLVDIGASVVSRVLFGETELPVDIFSSFVNTTECVNQKLRDLTTRTISTDTVNSVLEELTNITKTSALFAPEDVGNSFSILNNATGLLDTDMDMLEEETYRYIVRGASDLMAVDGSVLEQSARNDGVQVNTIPTIVERWTDGLVDVLPGDSASVQVERNIVVVAYRFITTRAAFKGSANEVNSSCSRCKVEEASNDAIAPLLIDTPVNYSISSDSVESIAVTFFRDSRLFAGIDTLNPVSNGTTLPRDLINRTFVNSPVLSLQTRRLRGAAFEGEAVFSLPTSYFGNRTLDSRACSFWVAPTVDAAGRWSNMGCELVSDVGDYVTCSCNHLTNFAILANYAESVSPSVNAVILSYITYIGVGVSVFCMVLTVGVYLWYKRLREDLGRIIVMHLCVTLTISLLCFAFGIEETSHTDTCTAIAIVLHYFLLSAFAWMVVEGYHLYSTFVVVFHGSHRSDRRQHVRFAAFAYGVPALIVLATGLVIGEEGYGYEDACWLPTKNYEIWAFLGPMCLAILVNIVFFVRIMRSILSVSVANADKATRQRFIRGVRASASFLSIMGVTWVFGALLFSGAVAVQYLFTIFNVFQGLFIFIFHCVWNASVRDAVTGKSKRDAIAHMRSRSHKPYSAGAAASDTMQSHHSSNPAGFSTKLGTLGKPTPLQELSGAEAVEGYLDVMESRLGTADDSRANTLNTTTTTLSDSHHMFNNPNAAPNDLSVDSSHSHDDDGGSSNDDDAGDIDAITAVDDDDDDDDDDNGDDEHTALQPSSIMAWMTGSDK